MKSLFELLIDGIALVVPNAPQAALRAPLRSPIGARVAACVAGHQRSLEEVSAKNVPS